MKVIAILISTFCMTLLHMNLYCQNSVDSLCHALKIFEGQRSIGWPPYSYTDKPPYSYAKYIKIPKDHLLNARIDTTKPLDRIYVDFDRGVNIRGDNNSVPSHALPMHGWYRFVINTAMSIGGTTTVGVEPGESPGLDRSLSRSARIFIEVISCFDDGIPCCEWKYTESWSGSDETKEYVHKKETYNNGLLNGSYIIYTHKGDTLYNTTFHEGTGYYQDYFPDGTLRLHGMVERGYRNGTWIHYIYKYERYIGVVVEKFDHGKLLAHDIFDNTHILEKLKKETRK